VCGVGDNAESAARSSGSSPSDESSPDTVASSSESRGPVMTCQEQRLLRPIAVELSDDEDDTSGIATQVSSQVTSAGKLKFKVDIYR